MEKSESNFERIKIEIKEKKNNVNKNAINNDIKNVNKNTINNVNEIVVNNNNKNVKLVVKIEKEEIQSRETIYLNTSIVDRLEEYSIILYSNKKSKSKLANILLEYALNNIEIQK